MNGKGDTPRPLSVSRKQFEENWDLAFGHKQRNVPDPLPLRKLIVPLIEDEIKPLEKSSVLEKFKADLHVERIHNSELNDRYTCINDVLHPLTIEQVRETPQSIIDEIFGKSGKDIMK